MKIPFGVLALVLGGGYFSIERFPDYLGPLPGLTSLETFSGPVSHVRDGDTIEVGGQAIRFGSLDCAERDTPQGVTATARMLELTAGQRVSCHTHGRSSHDRLIGSCTLADGTDLGGLMIQDGTCQRYW